MILHSREDITSQSEMLWLHLCSEEFTGTETATDSTFIAADNMVATVDNMRRAIVANMSLVLVQCADSSCLEMTQTTYMDRHRS